MGYRSEVAYAFYGVSPEHEAVVKLWLDGNLPLEMWTNLGGSVHPMEDGYILHVVDVKWYDSYPEVKKMKEVVDNFVDLFCRDDTDIGMVAGAENVRVGEESGDVEEDGYGDCQWLLSTQTKICF